MVVTALLGILAAVIVPRVAFRRSDVGLARATLSSLVRLVRIEAISSGKLHRIRLETAGARCVPEILEGEKFVAMDDDLARPRALPVDRLDALLTAGGPAEAFWILPTGFVEPALVEVEVDGEVSTLAVAALTGRVEARSGPARRR